MVVVVTRIAARFFGKGSAPTRVALNAAFFGALTTVLLVHGLAPYEAQPAGDDGVDRATTGLAKLLWWISGSMLLVSLIRLFLIFERTPREGRLLQDILVGMVFVGTALSIVSYVFRIPVGTLIATSGVFAIVLGLALQNTLADVFSGVALNLGKPYRIGDWIVLDDGIQGRVVETNWRATHLLSGTNDLVIVPNSALAKARLVNQSSPDETHGISLTLRIRPTHSPSVVEDVMRTVLSSSNHILKHPEPAVKITALDSAAVEVELNCRVKDISRTMAAKNELFDLAFRHSRAAGMSLAAPASAPVSFTNPGGEEHQRGTPWRLIASVPLFAALTDEEKEHLASTFVKRVFEKGAIIVSEGETVDSLAIVRSGVVVVERDVSGTVVELTRLSPHDCFGERGVLTDTPETATKRALTPVVIYEAPKDVLRQLMQSRKDLLDHLGMLSFKHAEHDSVIMADRVKATEQPSYSFTDRIRHLFDMSEDV
ncbi:mechanosensitive ion channel family protein [Rhizobium ruizarguesonis]